MGQLPSLVVILLAILSLSSCSMYSIIPMSMDSDDTNCSYVTLNQFARSLHDEKSSIILMFQPGNHTLSAILSVFNKSEFRMMSNGSSDVKIVCESQGKFSVKEVDSVVIDGLTFVGCNGNTFVQVSQQFTLNNATFIDAENSTSLLTLRGLTSARIYNGYFLSNIARSSDYTALHEHNGAIISNIDSNLSIYDSVFQDNDIRAIYSELGQEVVLNRCQFLRNSANYGGVIYAAKTKLEISECIFSYNTGEARFRIICLISGSIKIVGTNFTRNSEVLLAERNNIKMIDCRFESNYIPKPTIAGFTHFVNNNYDAIVLVINSITTMNHSTFYANEAIENGGILVFGNATVNYKDAKFIKNKAFEGTIVLISSGAIFEGSMEFDSNIGCLSALQSRILFVGNASFSNGTSSTREHDIIRGGALTIFFSTLNFTGPYSKTEFVYNYAINGGALYAAESVVYIDREVMIMDNWAFAVGGGIFIYRSFLLIQTNVIVSSNQAKLGGGIYVESAAITVTSSQTSSFHSLILENNTATDGGGFYFSANAHIYVYQLDPRRHYITVRLTSNSARRGGAVFVNDETNIGMCNGSHSITGQVVSSECFFQVVDLYRENGSLGLIFESNDANKGSVMFGGLLDRCLVTALTMSPFFDTDLGTSFAPLTGLPYLVNVSNHSFQIDDSNSIASTAVKVCICSNNEPNCSVLESQRQVERGKKFIVSVAAVDQAENLVNTTITAEVLSPTAGLGEGQQSQMVSSSCTNLTYSLTSSKSDEKFMIYADGPCRSAIPSHRVVTVHFSNCSCPIGFEVNSQMPSTCECICSRLLEGPLNFIDGCKVENQSITKVSNSWIDYRNDIGFLFSYRCPYNYCVSNLSVNLNTEDGSNVQCANNRAGALCGGCQQNYSLSLDQTSCIICDGIWPLYTVLITLVALILGLCIVVIILFLNLTVTSGTINGFFFSANILKAIFPFPSQKFPTYLVTFLNLDIGLNICYYDGLDIYAKTWLELGLPLYLIFIVAMVIILSRYSPTFARCIGKRNPIETLATLIFLSYAKLLQFPILALSCGELFQVDKTVSLYKGVWLPDASIGCFNNKHVIMFIVGLVVMVLVLIYTLLIFSWQWIVKLPNWKIFAIIRNTKLQSFIEMHHIPYTSGHRYWTGLLLLVRILVYVVEVGFDPFATYLTVIITLSALFIIKSLSTRVYKKWPVDVLESVLIVNTITLAAVAFYTSTNKGTNIPEVATYLSTCVMGILLIVVIVYHLHHQVLKGKLDHKKWLRFRKSKPPTEPTIETEENDGRSQRDATRNQSRHPLSSDRFNSVLLVMGNVTDNDYNQLNAQQELERNAESTEEDQNPVPVQPTVSVLEVPFSGLRYVPYNSNS